MKKNLQKYFFVFSLFLGGLAGGNAFAFNDDDEYAEYYDFPTMQACIASCEGSCASAGGAARCFWRIK
ncbi:hypothetical protein [Aliikangiella coralliicola]|uniref:Secreted protein n=1 Tax=Aliikangiella coralliicola TaxID=2592383 RepID=A0A545UEZ7_9GAMM|nr:hypothetical protein [Aliikangiella coralliicola]TQV88050.1 hypothetical protein FLL46_09585 [Aliikangiella coralliicola]